MSTFPRIEARVSAIERRQTSVDARIEELSEDMIAGIKALSNDMSASFDQLAQYHIQTEKQIDERFSQVDARFEKIEGDISTLKGDVSTLKGDVTNIKATMATKEDMTAMESRILDAFKQLLTMINPQYPTAQ